MRDIHTTSVASASVIAAAIFGFASALAGTAQASSPVHSWGQGPSLRDPRPAHAMALGYIWGVGPSLRDAPSARPAPAAGNTAVISSSIHVPAAGESHASKTVTAASPLASRAIAAPRNTRPVDVDSRVSSIGNDTGITGFYADRDPVGIVTSPLRTWDGRGNFGFTTINEPGQRPYFQGVTGPIYPEGRSDRRIIR